MKKIVLNLIIIMSLTACHPSGEEVAGKYHAKHDKGTEYIEMKADGTFTQYFKNDTIEESNEGTWEFEYRKGQWKIELADYVTYALPINNEIAQSRIGKKGFASVYWEEGRIIFNPDYENYNYHRKE